MYFSQGNKKIFIKRMMRAERGLIKNKLFGGSENLGQETRGNSSWMRGKAGDVPHCLSLKLALFISETLVGNIISKTTERILIQLLQIIIG